MGFVPQSGKHSLIEAVFGLLLERPWAPNEIAQIKAHDAKLKEFLPRVNDTNSHEFVIGPNGVPTSNVIQASGVVYERIKPDGNIAWRLGVDQNGLYVNCLEYTRWAEVWPKVVNLMQLVSQAIPDTDMRIAGAAYQTIDSFYWDSPREDYRASLLLNVTGENVPSSIDGRGTSWHLHQGWFELPNGEPSGRILKRVHFDAIEHNIPMVKMDTNIQQGFDTPVQFGEIELALTPVFERLHDQNKDVLLEFLAPEILTQIEVL